MRISSLKRLAFSFLYLLFTGCSYSYIEKGSFEALVPETFTGLAYPIGNDTTNVWKANITIRNYSDRHLELQGIENKYEKTQNRTLYDDCVGCPKGKNIKADLSYHFKTFPVTGSIDYFPNAKRILIGFGAAFDPYPRLRSSVGYNSNFFEAGGFVSFGFQLCVDFVNFLYHALQVNIIWKHKFSFQNTLLKFSFKSLSGIGIFLIGYGGLYKTNQF